MCLYFIYLYRNHYILFRLIKTSPKNKSQSYSEIENVLENETYIDMETTTSENTSPEIRKPSYDPEKLKKTIFVGNLPIAITRKVCL